MTPSLKDEIQQARPFGSLEQEAFLSVVRTSAQLTDALEQVLRPAGISLAQFNVLRILRGSQTTGLCRNELRDRMLTRGPDMTRLLDRMEAAGLVVRIRSTEDRRLVSTHISEAGLSLLASVDDAVEQEHHSRLGHMGEESLRALIDLLRRIREP